MSKSQKISLVVLFLLAVLGAFYGVHNFYRAMPEVKVPITFDKSHSSAMMDSIMTDRGISIDDFKKITVMFESGKLYIDREFGADTIPAIHLKEKIPVWMWRRRYFVPLQKEEYKIGIRPDDGKLVYFNHSIPESLSGADIPLDSAKVIAEAFLTKHGYNLDDWELKESKTEKRPNRRDHWFTFELKNWSLGNAKHWVSVSVWGDEIGDFSDFLHIPEGWWREFSKVRSSNSMFQQVDQFLAFIFGLLMLGYLIFAFRRKMLAWKFGIIFGTIVFLAMVVRSLNVLPLSLFWYDTADNFTGFVFQQIFYAILNGGFEGLLTVVAAIAGERIYREFLPKFSYLPQLFSPSGWRTPQFRNAVIAGYLFAAMHIGFVVLFYVMGNKIGFWSPTQSNYTDIMSAFLPWLFPITIGIMASISEDFLFRLFGVSYLSKLFNSKVVGVIIPAFIWGFLHSIYPQEPGYVRGIEVGLIGIAAGWLMIRYGIVANLTWHFAVDTGLVGLLIIRQGDPLNIVLVILGVLLPSILILCGYIFGKKRIIAKNEEKIPPPLEAKVVEKVPKIAPTYISASARTKMIFGVLAVLGLIIAIFAPNYPSEDVAITRIEAQKKAKDVLSKHGVSVDSFRTATNIRVAPDDDEKRYVYQQEGWTGIEKFWGVAKWEPLYYWNARFYIPEEKNEYDVLLGQDGAVCGFKHYLEESDSGASISQDSAFVLALGWLKEFGNDYIAKWGAIKKDSVESFDSAGIIEKSVNEINGNSVIGWELIERNTTKRPNRTDHNFVWQSPDSVGQAHKRAGVKILGSEASGGVRFIKCPEEWQRQQRKTTPFTVIFSALPILLIAAIIVIMLLMFGSNIVRRKIKLSVLGWITVIAVFAYTLRVLNAIPTFMSSYYTSMPLKQWFIIQIVGKIMSILFGAISAVVAIGAIWGTELGRKIREKIPAGETMLLSVISVFYIAGVFALLRWLEIALNLPLQNPTITFPAYFATYLPILSVPADIVKKLCISFPLLIVAYIYLRKKFPSDWKLFIAGAVAVILFSFSGNRTFWEILWSAAKWLVLFVAGWALVKNLLKDSIPIYITAILFAVPFQQASQWLQCAGNPFFLWNAVSALALGVLLWISVAFFFSKRSA